MPVEKNTVFVSVNNFPVKALVDTGASISCLSAHLMPKLGITPGQLESSNVRDAVAVGGEKHSSLGAVSLSVSFNGPTITPRFHVFKSFHQSLILGLDFFKPMTAYLMQKITPSICETQRIKRTQLPPIQVLQK